MLQKDKWFPKYGEEFEYITLDDAMEVGPAKAIGTSIGVEDDPRILSGNCFKPGTLTEHDLAIVEDCIRGLAK